MANKVQASPQPAKRISLSSAARLVVVLLLVFIGCLALIGFTTAHWAEHQILTTDNWVAVVGPIPRQPEVGTALSDYVTTQLFANVPISREIANALPPRASFLAGPLASQLQSLTKTVTYRVVVSSTFDTVWVAANRSAMNQLLGAARGQKPPLGSRLASFNLNISGVKDQIASKLGTTASALPSLHVASSSGNSLMLDTNLKTKRQQVWSTIRAIDLASSVLLFFAIACFLVAIAFAKDRVKAVVAIAGVTIVLVLIELIALKVAKQDILNQIKNASYVPAVTYIFDVLVGPLRTRILYSGLIALIVLVIALLCSSYKWARTLRSFVHIPSPFDTDVFGWWYAARHWTKRHLYYVEGALAFLLLLWLAFVASVNGRLIINGVLVTISLITIVYIFAYPHKPGALAT